jgi:hypothetical protein
MVKGLPLFKEHFKDFAGQYMIIGGTACSVLLDNVGIAFRATKDLDIVLCAEALTDEFFRAFWAFVRKGGYNIKQKSDGEPRLYRFSKPTNPDYPTMIELFSRKPKFSIAEDSNLAPMPADDEAYSLSAILLNDGYYQFIREGVRKVDGIDVVDANHLIPLKIRAYFDMKQKKGDGKQVDSKTVSKHKNDTLRLLAIAPVAPAIALPEGMAEDISRFIAEMREERPNPRDLGITTMSLDDMLENLASMYQ